MVPILIIIIQCLFILSNGGGFGRAHLLRENAGAAAASRATGAHLTVCGAFIISLSVCVWCVLWQLCVKWRTGAESWEPVDSVAPELVKAFRDRQRQAEASTAEPAQELALKSKRGREDDE